MTESSNPPNPARESRFEGPKTRDPEPSESTLPVAMQIRDLENMRSANRYDLPPGRIMVAGTAFSLVAGLFLVFVGYPESDAATIAFAVLVAVALSLLGWMARWVVKNYAEQKRLTQRINDLKALAPTSDDESTGG